MADVSVLNRKKTHFSEEHYFDLRLRADASTSAISPLYFESKKVDLSQVRMGFDARFPDQLNHAYLTTDQSWPIFSSACYQLIRQHHPSIDAFPVDVFVDGKLSNEAFFLIRPPRLKGLIDPDHSQFQAHPLGKDKIYEVSKLTIISPEPSIQMFRLYEYPVPILIQDELAQALMRAEEMQGFSLLPLSEFPF